MGPSIGSQQEVRAPDLPAISQQTSKNSGGKPRETPPVPLMENAITAASVSPAISQSVAPPVSLRAQSVTDTR